MKATAAATTVSMVGVAAATTGIVATVARSWCPPSPRRSVLSSRRTWCRRRGDHRAPVHGDRGPACRPCSDFSVDPSSPVVVAPAAAPRNGRRGTSTGGGAPTDEPVAATEAPVVEQPVVEAPVDRSLGRPPSLRPTRLQAPRRARPRPPTPTRQTGPHPPRPRAAEPGHAESPSVGQEVVTHTAVRAPATPIR